MHSPFAINCNISLVCRVIVAVLTRLTVIVILERKTNMEIDCY